MNPTKLYLPNKEQIERFLNFVTNVHSWYKHIPLFKGAEFTFYLESDLDKVYPSKHPKLPFGNNAEAYEKAFGQLFFKYKINDMQSYLFNSKVEEKDTNEHSESETIVLYPYCHHEFENGISLMQDDLVKIKRGDFHENSKLILDYFYLFDEKEELWNKLNEVEQQWVLDFEDSEFNLSVKMKPISQYLSTLDNLESVRQQLQSFEISKISNAINQLIKTLKL